MGTEDSNNEAFSFNGLSENEEKQSFGAGYPSITTFDSAEEAEIYAMGFARGKNFVIVRNRSKKNKKTGLLQSIDLVCNRAKKSSPMKEGAVRKTKSKRIECKFFWKVSFVGGTWKITVKESVHNHRPSGSERLGHASSVRLTDEQFFMVGEMIATATRASDIMVNLRSRFPDQVFYEKTIYNAIQKHRIVKLAGRNPMQALVDGISGNDNYVFASKYDSNAVVTGFFFAHRLSIELFQRYSSVLVIDAAYKTNRYGLPLVEVVGLTNSNKTFFLCAAFMASESASDYVWFLEQMKSKCFISNISPKIIATDRELALISAIAVVVPDTYNILCRWHINKNIKVKVAKYFPGISAERKDEILKAWSSMVSSSSTEVDFESNFSEFSMQFASGEAGMRFIDYIKDTWVENHKEK